MVRTRRQRPEPATSLITDALGLVNGESPVPHGFQRASGCPRFRARYPKNDRMAAGVMPSTGLGGITNAPRNHP